MNEVELLKMAIQITEIILSDSKNMVNGNTINRAKDLYRDSKVSDYTKLLMLIKKELTELTSA